MSGHQSIEYLRLSPVATSHPAKCFRSAFAAIPATLCPNLVVGLFVSTKRRCRNGLRKQKRKKIEQKQSGLSSFTFKSRLSSCCFAFNQLLCRLQVRIVLLVPIAVVIITFPLQTIDRLTMNEILMESSFDTLTVTVLFVVKETRSHLHKSTQR